MKTTIVTLLATITAAFAGPPTPVSTPPPNPIVNELEADLLSGVIIAEVQGIYAPKLAEHWGAEVSISHPVITDASAPINAGVGVSAMLLNGGYYAGTFGINLQKSFTLTLGSWHPIITPRVRTGAYLPFATPVATTTTTSQTTNTNFGAFVEPGFQLSLWQKKDAQGNVMADFYIGGNMKYISSLSGPTIQTYGGFAGISLHF